MARTSRAILACTVGYSSAGLTYYIGYQNLMIILVAFVFGLSLTLLILVLSGNL